MTLALAELAKNTKIYDTINGWDTCTPNVLANKIKKVEKYCNSLCADKNIDVQLLYSRYLKNDFKNVVNPYDLHTKPTTWSFEITRYRETVPNVIGSCGAFRRIDGNIQVRVTEYDIKINREWFNHYCDELQLNLDRMKQRLEESKIATASTAKSNANEKFTCNICGGCYSRTHKSHHIKTSKHTKAVESAAESVSED